MQALDRDIEQAQKKYDTADAAVTRADEAAAQAGEVARKSKALAVDSANKALEAERLANDHAKVAGLKPPYAGADTVKDVFDAGRLDPKAQERLFGTRAVVTPQEAAKEDAKQVARMLRPHDYDFQKSLYSIRDPSREIHPAAAVRELGALLQKDSSPEYRKALLEAVKPQLESIGGTLTPSPPGDVVSSSEHPASQETFEAFGKTASTLRPEERRTFAEGLAAGMGTGNSLESGMEEGLRESIRRGTGSAFSVELATALERSGKSGQAEAITRTAQAEVEAIREDFAEKSGKVEDLNAQVARLAAGFGPAMTSQEQQNALNSFKKRHQAEYEALEDAAKKLKGALEVSTEVLKQQGSSLFADKHGGRTDFTQEALETVKQLNGLVGTDVGQKFIDDEVKKQGNGEPSFLDGVSNLLAGPKLGKDANDIAKGLTTAVTKGLASAALKAAASGEDIAGAKRVYDNVLGKNPVLFGVTAEDMDTLKGHFKNLLENKKGAADELDSALRKLSVDAPGTTGASEAGSALRGLGVVAGLFGTANSVTDVAKGLSEGKGLELMTATKALGDSLSATADTSLFVFDVLNKDAAAARTVLGKLGPAGGILGAVGDGLAVANALRNGDNVEAVAKSASALGGALLAAAALSQAVPVAGQVVGGLLLAAGTGVSLWNESQKRQEKQEDTRAFLQGAGFSPRLAEQLKDPDTAVRTGQFLTQLAEQLHTTPQELRQQLERVTDRKKLDAFFYAVEKTPRGDDGRFVTTDATPGRFTHKTYGAGGHGTSQAYFVTEYYLQSLSDAAAHLRNNGVLD
ncbi:hypothetical protein [Corallococcus sp. AB030]|uniref:hypothetical protein n=1 Tax=Corallococcus sp. AB030 TaxID=2316716 RepID=UPI0011E5DBE2|nr:hypothetical protein [Corallococcus sp. AB030]